MQGQIKQRSPGSWQLCYDLPRGADQKRKQKYCTVRGTKKDAEKELRRLLAEVDAGLVVDTARGTVADHLIKWLQMMEGKVKPTTLEGLRIVVNAHLIPHLGQHKLESLKPTDVRDFIITLQTQGNRAKGKQGKPLAGITVHRIGKALKQALEDAVEMGVLARNPARVRLPSPKAGTKRVLTEAEITRVMAETRRSYLHTMILLGLTTGARRGEILALRWQDVNRETGEVTIQRNLIEVGGAITCDTPKTRAGRRTVFLPEFARQALIRHRGEQAARRLAIGTLWQENDLVVCADDGHPVRPGAASVRMKQMMDRLGLPGVTLHGLRHSFASLAIKNGANLKTLQTIMGHESVNITVGLYGHLLGGEQEALAAGLDEMLAKVMGG